VKQAKEIWLLSPQSFPKRQTHEGYLLDHSQSGRGHVAGGGRRSSLRTTASANAGNLSKMHSSKKLRTSNPNRYSISAEALRRKMSEVISLRERVEQAELAAGVGFIDRGRVFAVPNADPCDQD
jgi:hypothetical protein